MLEQGWFETIDHLHAKSCLLGGKQYHRALEFFKVVIIDRLPDPSELKQYVPTALGALRGGLNREDWEHATVEIIRTCVQEVTETSINYFIKHVLFIYRRLIKVAMADLKQGEKVSKLLRQVPQPIEEWIVRTYEELVWRLGVDASAKCLQGTLPFSPQKYCSVQS